MGFWLEDIVDDIGGLWPLEQYAIVAHHVGQFNCIYLTGRPLPEGLWVSRGWIRQHVSRHETLCAELERLQHKPEALQWFLALAIAPSYGTMRRDD